MTKEINLDGEDDFAEALGLNEKTNPVNYSDIFAEGTETLDNFFDSPFIDKVEEPLKASNDEEEDQEDIDLDGVEIEIQENEDEEEPQKVEEVVAKEEKSVAKEDSVGKDKKKVSRSQQRIQELSLRAKQAEAVAAKLLEEFQKAEKLRLSSEVRATEGEASRWSEEVNKAKRALAEALDEGDAKKIAEAQAELNDAQFTQRIVNAKKQNPSSEDEVKARVDEVTRRIIEETVSQTKINPQDFYINDDEDTPSSDMSTPSPDKWVRDNANLLVRKDIQDVASSLFDSLVSKGYSPNSQDLYAELEDKLTVIFPETVRWFGKKETTQEKTVKEVAPVEPKQKAPISGGSSQTTQQGTMTGNANQNESKFSGYTVKNGKVILKPTKDQAQMALQLGLDIKDYMREVIKADTEARRR